MQRTGGTAQRARSVASVITDFGVKGLTRTGLLNDSDGGVLTLANQIVAKGSKQSLVVKTVSWVMRPPDSNGPVFNYTILDQCNVKFKTPPGTGAQQTYKGMIIGVRWDITPERTVGHFTLADALQETLFILNNGLYGKLNTGILG